MGRLIVVLLLLGAAYLLLRTLQSRGGATTAWPVFARPVLTDPEQVLYRRLVDSGAEVFLMASGWPSPRIEHWSVLARARAIEDQAWVVACNSAGTHVGTQMGGRSVVVDPRGTVVAEAGTGEEILYAEVDPDLPRQWRGSFPVLTDRVL